HGGQMPARGMETCAPLQRRRTFVTLTDGPLRRAAQDGVRTGGPFSLVGVHFRAAPPRAPGAPRARPRPASRSLSRRHFRGTAASRRLASPTVEFIMEAIAHAYQPEDTGQQDDPGAQFPAREFKVYTHRQLENIKQVQALSEAQRFEMKVVSQVLPFRVNEYVLEELIDWDNIPDDPIFRLVFRRREMLPPGHFD